MIVIGFVVYYLRKVKISKENSGVQEHEFILMQWYIIYTIIFFRLGRCQLDRRLGLGRSSLLHITGFSDWYARHSGFDTTWMMNDSLPSSRIRIPWCRYRKCSHITNSVPTDRWLIKPHQRTWSEKLPDTFRRGDWSYIDITAWTPPAEILTWS